MNEYLAETEDALIAMGYTRADGVVAGGRALQQLFPRFPTKDTDLFILAPPTPEALDWIIECDGERIFHDRPDPAGSAFDPDLRASENWRVGRLDIIFSQHNFLFELFEAFDLGISKVAYGFSTRQLVLAEDAVNDIVRRQITHTKPATMNSLARAEKYHAKLGWPIRAYVPDPAF